MRVAEPEFAELEWVNGDGSWRALLYNDQEHSFAEVITLLVMATGFDLRRCAKITLEAHTAGRAEVVRTGEDEATRIAESLRAGGLLAAARPL